MPLKQCSQVVFAPFRKEAAINEFVFFVNTDRPLSFNQTFSNNIISPYGYTCAKINTIALAAARKKSAADATLSSLVSYKAFVKRRIFCS